MSGSGKGIDREDILFVIPPFTFVSRLAQPLPCSPSAIDRQMVVVI